MKPHRFAYADPGSTLEVLELLASLGDEAKILAGGQSLLPMLSMRLARPAWLVDVTRVASLRYVEQDDGFIRIGAATPDAAVEADPSVADLCPLLAKALPHIGHRAIRNRGTIGGSIAHADPAAELPAVLLALRGSVIATSQTTVREIAAADLFVMPFSTTLRPDELLEEIRLPRSNGATGTALVELARRQGDFAMAGVAAVATVGEDDHLTDVELAAFGVGPTPVSLRSAAEGAVGRPVGDPQVLADVGAAAADEVSPADDLHASSEYRKAVLPTLVRRALLEAAAEAQARRETEEGTLRA